MLRSDRSGLPVKNGYLLRLLNKYNNNKKINARLT